MAEISYPFESQNTGTADAPVYDRAITADNERTFNKLRYLNGVFQTPTNLLQVTAPGGFVTSVAPGGAHIEGALYNSDAAKTFTHTTPDAQYDRIDRIVIRFDTAMDARNIGIYKLQGTPAASPQPPALTQEPNYFELALADVRVRKGSDEITNADVTDQRLNSDLCGLVVPAIPTPLNLTDIFNQYQSSLEQYMDLVTSAIDDTTAGNLQNQINEKADMVHEHSAVDITSGALPVMYGGTGADKAKEARLNLGAVGMDDVYPVGSIYLSYNSTSPATLFGGSWTRISSRFLYAAASASEIGNTGGAATVTLTTAQIPSHTHAVKGTSAEVSGSAGAVCETWPDKTNNRNGVTLATGGGGAHENMPPYLSVYMWRRTA